MDVHRTFPNKAEVPSGSPCLFCQRYDVNFDKRDPIDQMLIGSGSGQAFSHLTENGHVKHKLVELRMKLDRSPLLQRTRAA